MIELVLTPASAHRVRFAICPLEEALGALRVLAGTRRHPAHLPWLAGAARDLPIRELLAVLSARRYITDFLAPPTSGPATTAEEQLALVRRTPPKQVAAELALVDADLTGLPTDPAHARDLLADQLELAWTELIAPHWSRIANVLAADIEHRSRRLAEGGLALMLGEVHPRVSLTDNAVLVQTPTRNRARLDERGLQLLPSVFGWPDVAVVLLPPWQPALVYPARGAARVWQPEPRPPEALAAVLGRTKAALLYTLDEPAGTTALAGALGLSPATVSGHLTALRDAGLLIAARRGRAVHYRRSALGDALLRA
ncbi:ArsR/SmtB family transcription factor [Qaidamihabitans albus]|uniref:ArsR/SmtB family transcription factor n=1 Tax=Qaidamihabitans albus TaxID=2795733 RepID=UPI0018F22129|nr:DUF5937 family protein [Qaidamihabitans albus]